MGIESWSQLGAFGVLATILVIVLIQQGKQYDKLIDNLIDVIQSNTAAMASVEKAINGLPEFVKQTSERLGRGAERFKEHERRLGKLENNK